MQRPIDTHTERLRSYLTGFSLALLLTAIPFGLVAAGALSTAVMIPGVFASAIVQILVHLHYFLHLDLTNPKPMVSRRHPVYVLNHRDHGGRHPMDPVRPEPPHDGAMTGVGGLDTPPLTRPTPQPVIRMCSPLSCRCCAGCFPSSRCCWCRSPAESTFVTSTPRRRMSAQPIKTGSIVEQ
jgi:hypothetical protein